MIVAKTPNDCHHFARPSSNLAEPLSTTKNELIVFCGEMMERLTMYHYRAVMHRVYVQPTLLYAIRCLALMIARADLRHACSSGEPATG